LLVIFEFQLLSLVSFGKFATLVLQSIFKYFNSHSVAPVYAYKRFLRHYVEIDCRNVRIMISDAKRPWAVLPAMGILPESFRKVSGNFRKSFRKVSGKFPQTFSVFLHIYDAYLSTAYKKTLSLGNPWGFYACVRQNGV
jgi:hypothetical protein